MRLCLMLPVAAALVFGAVAIQPVPAAAQTAPVAAKAQVPLISAAELRALMKSKKPFFLVDVRDPAEFSAGHIPGAVLMPLDTLPQTYKRIPKGAKLVVNCRSGVRSAEAVRFLMDHGYKHVVSLDGGYLAWSAAH
jgi:rhodanese-related sulfurtransferase